MAIVQSMALRTTMVSKAQRAGAWVAAMKLSSKRALQAALSRPHYASPKHIQALTECRNMQFSTASPVPPTYVSSLSMKELLVK